MTTLVFGGTGFIGLSIAERLLAAGESVRLFDRLPLSSQAAAAFAALPGELDVIRGDVTDSTAVTLAFDRAIDAVVLGAAVTADAAREAREPEAILQVNLATLPTILRAARDAGVRRVVNLSSAAVYGRAAVGVDVIDEDALPQPIGLYGISKLASELVGGRLADLWAMDFVSLRLSAVFGPWERATGVRDTTSPQYQITEAARRGTPALLARPGLRDWVYALDVAAAVHLIAQAPALRHRIYNVSSPQRWTALAWGERFARSWPGFECRLARPGEAATIDLHAELDRAPLSVSRLQTEFAWLAHFGVDASADHLAARCRHAGSPFEDVS